MGVIHTPGWLVSVKNVVNALKPAQEMPLPKSQMLVVYSGL